MALPPSPVSSHLECDAHTLPAPVEHGAPAVAAVDGSIYLNGQQICAAMAVVRDLNPRDDARSDTDGIPPDRVADDRDRVLQAGQGPELQGGHAPPEFLILDIQHGNVTLHACRHHAGQIQHMRPTGQAETATELRYIEFSPIDMTRARNLRSSPLFLTLT